MRVVQIGTRNVSPYFLKDHEKKLLQNEAMASKVKIRRVSPKVRVSARVLSPYFHNHHMESEHVNPAETSNFKARKISHKADKARKVFVEMAERTVSPYFQKPVIIHENEAETSKVKVTKLSCYFQQHQKVCKASNISPCFHNETGKMSVNVEEAENGYGNGNGVEISNPQVPNVNGDHGNGAQTCNLQVRKVPSCSAGSMQIGKAKRKRKVATLSPSQKWDEAYRKRTPDNTWVPPRSHLHLIQEDHIRDPWRVLVICMLLNLTTGRQVRAVILDFFKLCPDAEACIQVSKDKIVEIIRKLGLHKRAAMLQRFSRE